MQRDADRPARLTGRTWKRRVRLTRRQSVCGVPWMMHHHRNNLPLMHQEPTDRWQAIPAPSVESATYQTLLRHNGNCCSRRLRLLANERAPGVAWATRFFQNAGSDRMGRSIAWLGRTSIHHTSGLMRRRSLHSKMSPNEMVAIYGIIASLEEQSKLECATLLTLYRVRP